MLIKLGLMVKDIGIAMMLAGKLNLSPQLSRLDQEMWTAARERAGADTSVSILVRWLEHTIDVKISAGNKA